MLDWFSRMPAYSKLLFVFGGGLLSTFSSRLPENLQDFGLWAGYAVIALAIIGLMLHAAQSKRGGDKVAPQDLITVGLAGVWLFATIALGGAIWQFRQGSTQQVVSTAPNAQSANRPPFDPGADLGSFSPADGSPLPPPPTRYLSQNDKDRIADALFVLSELNEKRILKLGRDAGVPSAEWTNLVPEKRILQAPEIKKKVLSAHNEARLILEKIYTEWLTDYQDYRQELVDVLEYPEKENVRIPLNKFILRSDQFRMSLDAYIVVMGTSQLTPEIEQQSFNLVAASHENYHWAVAELVGGWQKMKIQIDTKRKSLK